jgi:hypothetical protein
MNARNAKRAIHVGAVFVLLLAACGGSSSAGPGKTSTGARASCEADTDCVVTDTTSCCAPCLDAPRAIPALAQAQREKTCGTVDCAPASDRIECPKVEPKAGYVAKCIDGTCSAVKK